MSIFALLYKYELPIYLNIIVRYPNETEDDFMYTYNFLEEYGKQKSVIAVGMNSFFFANNFPTEKYDITYDARGRWRSPAVDVWARYSRIKRLCELAERIGRERTFFYLQETVEGIPLDYLGDLRSLPRGGMASFARPPIDPGSQWRAGHVDAVVAWDGKIEIEGWAFDPVNETPVEQVIAVTEGEEIIFCANLATHRIDVANALRQPAGWRYGWWMLLEHELWRDADRLSIYGYSHGSIHLLNRGIISLSGGAILWPEQSVPRPSVSTAQA